MHTRITVLLLVTCAELAGCSREPHATFSDAQRICLVNPDGGLPVDQLIERTQEQARKLPMNPESWSVAGQGWVRKARQSADPGFYVNVRGCADAALAIASGYRPALQLQALSFMNDHRFADARRVAEEILTDEPNDVVTLGVLSDALLELGEFDKAAAATQRMVDLQPDMSSYSRAAYFRWLQGDITHATLFMQYALNGRDIKDREPTAWTFVQAAAMYWNQGDYDGAEAVLGEALTWVPDYMPALTWRGRVALSRGKPDQAVRYLDKAYAISPLTETAWLLGDARQMLGDTAGAEREYQRVVLEGRKSDRLTLALFYATKNRDLDEALRLIDAERASRGGVHLDDVYAWVLYRQGRIAEARAASDRALQYGTQDARLLYHAGIIRLATGERAGLTLVSKALALNPRLDDTLVAEAAGWLARASSTPTPDRPSFGQPSRATGDAQAQ